VKGKELKEWRQFMSYTQAELAEKLGVDVVTVSRWERGKRKIPSFLHLALRTIKPKGL
jgi:transcriptional regulator with XRE-family HTH domain